MPFSLAHPTLLQEFYLVKADIANDNLDVPSWIHIRYADQFAEEERNKTLRSVNWILHEETKIKYTMDLIADEVWLQEVYYTLADSNLSENDEEPLFRFENNRLAMTEEEFLYAFYRLPMEYVDEIIECVHEVNPRWKDGN